MIDRAMTHLTIFSIVYEYNISISVVVASRISRISMSRISVQNEPRISVFGDPNYYDSSSEYDEIEEERYVFRELISCKVFTKE